MDSERIDLGRGTLSYEQRKEILNQLFFEGPKRIPYLKQFYLLLLLAAIIATLGLMRNSASVVIGAMLISPLMTPILGVSASLVMGWPIRAGRLAIRLAFATLFVFGTSFLILFIFNVPTNIIIPPEILARTNPKMAELFIGLCAGIAAAYMLVRDESSFAVPGVAISVALVPPLCVSGILTYFKEYGLAWEAFVLYATNLVAIVLTAGAVMLLTGFTPKKKDVKLIIRVTAGMITATLIVLLVAIPLANRALSDFSDLRDRNMAISVTQAWIGDNNVEIVEVEVEDNLFQVFLRINLPLESLYNERHLAMDKYLSQDMTIDSLKHRLIEVLGKEVNVTLKGSFAFWNSTCPVPADCKF